MGGPITVERLKSCDWSVHKFIEVNFSKLTDSNQIFRIDLVCIHYHLCEISCQIIKWIFLGGPYELWTIYPPGSLLAQSTYPPGHCRHWSPRLTIPGAIIPPDHLSPGSLFPRLSARWPPGSPSGTVQGDIGQTTGLRTGTHCVSHVSVTCVPCVPYVRAVFVPRVRPVCLAWVPHLCHVCVPCVPRECRVWPSWVPSVFHVSAACVPHECRVCPTWAPRVSHVNASCVSRECRVCAGSMCFVMELLAAMDTIKLNEK